MNAKRKLELATKIISTLQDKVKSVAFQEAMASDRSTSAARQFSQELGQAKARIDEALAIENRADELEAADG